MTWGQNDLVQTGVGMLNVPVISREVAAAITVGFSVLSGHHVVKNVMFSVVAWPTVQLITVGAQDVMV